MTLYLEFEAGKFRAWGGEDITQTLMRWGTSEVVEEDGTDTQTGETIKVPVLKAYPDYYEGDVQHPLSIEDHWTDEALAEIGLYRPVPAGGVPDHHRLVSTSVERVEGVVRFVNAIEEFPLEERKDIMLAALAALRWQAETGGLTFGGMRVSTDRDTQGRVSDIVGAYDKGYIVDAVSFKIGQGIFVQLGAADVRAIEDAGAKHIQACFKREDYFTDVIKAANDHDALDAIDFSTGWPGAEE